MYLLVLLPYPLLFVQEVPSDQQDQPSEAEQCPLQYREHHARLHSTYLSPDTPDRVPLHFTETVALDVPPCRPTLKIRICFPSLLALSPSTNFKNAQGGRWHSKDRVGSPVSGETHQWVNVAISCHHSQPPSCRCVSLHLVTSAQGFSEKLNHEVLGGVEDSECECVCVNVY